ncbi:hypothetical protein ANANG_G00100950 [Anguilla anguilla]|uniref:HAT C-terminal dimerisation domain-containing protein n=1 Tax=Anguilla anguilla TaxID=7936 RepID=A0A9D3MIQ6_ANGAN|nr:hypothetical protein ANANG_G00100950 [Anguilla anguilla]
MEWLLHTITTVITKLEKTRASQRFCKPLVDALQDGLKNRFGKMMSDPEVVAAAILHPKFKTSWTSDEDVLKLGLSYIKEHLPDHEPLPRPADNSSSASDEEDFFSNMKHVHTQETTKQLDAYVACTSEIVDILSSYPAVSNLSLKLNTALPASAACESLFSAAGLIFSPRRGRIDSHNFENQLLLKLNKDFFKFD